ncbi:MAG: hypothetical protein MUF18_00700 [Fimbriiglobus sp.]|jgi:hypothetical protein|nr:hypothetical protein [Fimbriiglobus sp.]
MSRTLFMFVTLALPLGLIGCGGSSDGPSVEVSLESDLQDLGGIYDLHTKQMKRPPAKFDDLSAVSANPPVSATDGRLKVFWGTSLSASGTAILAHEATATEKGGWVLLTDGKTVKKMTAEEFAATAKAKK